MSANQRGPCGPWSCSTGLRPSTRHFIILLAAPGLRPLYNFLPHLSSMSRFPPTPAMSGEFTIKDQPADPSDMFALPAAALSPAVDSSRRSSRSDPTYVPVSPESPRARGAGGRSGATKRSLEEFELPPPPTRTRKIIQMKPKSPASKASTKPKEKEQAGPQTSPESPPATSGKRKQPSATSAAGRKIARKTAHSLIERRRRSKMNEEFGTLKDMIPACRGQEMHKLAILSVRINLPTREISPVH